jgi:hypothetical protein
MKARHECDELRLRAHATSATPNDRRCQRRLREQIGWGCPASIGRRARGRGGQARRVRERADAGWAEIPMSVGSLPCIEQAIAQCDFAPFLTGRARFVQLYVPLLATHALFDFPLE